MANQNIQVEVSPVRKNKPNSNELVFGTEFTDHMFMMDYNAEQGWYDARIVPYQDLKISPASMVFHYGQSVFEGLKAFRTEDGRVQLFRPDRNVKRLNLSNNRLVIPPIDEDLALEALKRLVEIDKEWVPHLEGTSLYIRPFVISTEPFLGVAPSQHYKFIIIMSPVGSYYKEGIKPVKIAVENEFVRAVKGGTGEAKTGGNYASSLKAQEIVEKEGYSQVLWLDGIERKYIEEVGSMNVFFKINGEVVTPMLSGSILSGVTRDSVIHLLKHWNIPASERKISIEELYQAHQEGALEEAFGTGTAAVISPIGELYWEGKHIYINDGKTGELSKRVYDTITGIQYGRVEDEFKWTVNVEKEKVK
ncbi:branched-chain amino acid aminotransferase [Virgibacillus sp. MSJ-26]|uniref:branched-chain amino acid aminotransferase n=1 Tax=Virgibacillus sp. MSJ-26 TaxID=2841522 RepID=UPI001C1093B4|nr:branched-chain amino acid aminotransferase [Virgibacillus sp. MSJ-26]MBU5466233.1 branched-chain amino acid aminotransferase [Virgibacillus sp. MSJ-26]